MNYKLIIAYDGTNYSGWQVQSKTKTIQGEIENALEEIFQKKINLIGSGRTDAGVHAQNQVANFKVDSEISPFKIKKAINSKISKDIYVKSCNIVEHKFHSRFSAIKRNYIYNISTMHDIFNQEYEWYLKFEVNRKILDECSQIILKKKDFKNFCKLTSQKENNFCKIYVSKWMFKNDSLKYNIKADRFMHHMVRFLIGTMIEVARGRYTIGQFESLFTENNSEISVAKAPAKGLFLNNIEF